MKFLKSSLSILITIVALMAAINTHAQQCFDCTTEYLYYFNGSAYVPAGDYGWDFYCNGTIGICVYYRPDPVYNPGHYAPCKYGTYTLIP